MRKTMGRVTAALLVLLLLSGQCLAAMPSALVPVGEAVGLRLNAKGVAIAGFEEEQPSPAEKAPAASRTPPTINSSSSPAPCPPISPPEKPIFLKERFVIVRSKKLI